MISNKCQLITVFRMVETNLTKKNKTFKSEILNLMLKNLAVAFNDDAIVNKL